MRRPPSYTRRRVLQSVTALSVSAVAGCLAPVVGDSCSAGTDLTMETATDTQSSRSSSAPIDELPPLSIPVVEDAIANGTTTYRGYYEPSLHTDYVVPDGEQAYYEIDVEAGEHTETTGYRYEVVFGDDVPTPTGTDRIVAFADLPNADQEAFLGTLGRKAYAKFDEVESANFGVTFAYPDAATREQSLFVPRTDVDYVRWRGRDMRIRFEGERTVTVATYTVTANRVADSTGAFAEHVRSERGVVLEDLPGDQREIVDQAIDGGYSACEPYSDAFQQLLDRLSAGEHDYASFVRYEGSWYIVRVSQWVE